MNNLKTTELFDLLKSRLIIDLKDGEELCPSCKGLKVTYRESEGKSYVQICSRCYTGIVYRCPLCGEISRQQMCSCKQAQDKRKEEFAKKEWDKMQEALKTATIVPIKDYDGYLTSLSNEERVVDAEEFSEQYLDDFDSELSPKMVCASVGEVAFTLNIQDIISDKSEDGYEDMMDNLDLKSPLLIEAQKLLDKWLEENESGLKVYSETNKIMVDLTELYDEGCKLHENK